MYEDILGPREEKVELKNEKMDNKKPIPPTVSGVKGRPTTGPPVNNNKAIDLDLEELDEDGCNCDDPEECTGCLNDNDVWST